MAASTPLPYSTLVHMLTIKLTPLNYLLWRNQVETLLRSQNLFGFVDGSSTPENSPDQDAAAQEKAAASLAAWNAQDQQLLSLLLSSLSEEAMTEVLGCTTTQTVWNVLEVAYVHHSKAREIQMKDALQSLRRQDRTVVDFAKQFKGYCDQLTAIGCPVTNVDQVHWFLRGLGSAFSTFSLSQMKVDPLPQFRDVQAKAESFEIFLKSLNTVPTTPQAAFTVQANGGSPFFVSYTDASWWWSGRPRRSWLTWSQLWATRRWSWTS